MSTHNLVLRGQLGTHKDTCDSSCEQHIDEVEDEEKHHIQRVLCIRWPWRTREDAATARPRESGQGGRDLRTRRRGTTAHKQGHMLNWGMASGSSACGSAGQHARATWPRSLSCICSSHRSRVSWPGQAATSHGVAFRAAAATRLPTGGRARPTTNRLSMRATLRGGAWLKPAAPGERGG